MRKLVNNITTATISKSNIEDSNTEGTNMGDINDVVCPVDYTNHSRREAFTPTGTETREEAQRQMTHLEDFGVCDLCNPGGILPSYVGHF